VETLATLARSHRVGAVTNTSAMREREVRELLAPAGLDELLEVLVTSVDAGAAKPDPEPLLQASSRLGVAPARCVFIGDDEIDGTAAASAGMTFVATDRGVRDAMDRLAASREGALADARRALGPLTEAAAAASLEHQDRLTKPAGSLGRLEQLGAQLAAIAGQSPPPEPNPAAVAIFAADHGVATAGVTPWPQEVTAQMVGNFAAGGAAINVIARCTGASVHVVDIGVAADVSGLETVIHRKVREGTADLSRGPAMTIAEAHAALDAGAEVAALLIEQGNAILVTGDMGIGNTTAAAAVIAALTGAQGAAVTGRGTGIDDQTLARKSEIVEAAAERTRGWLDPCSVLAEVGGLDIAGLAGFIIGAAAGGVPVVVDGVITGAALLVAERLAPGVAGRCIAGHLSTEPGASAALQAVGLRPLLDLEMRLGEGTGGALALPVIQASARVLREMATFEQAAVSEREQ
jgi:nicotinate-nucleotide--dimethylbenzimidazole phosphoribosyltransferase